MVRKKKSPTPDLPAIESGAARDFNLAETKKVVAALTLELNALEDGQHAVLTAKREATDAYWSHLGKIISMREKLNAAQRQLDSYHSAVDA